MGGFLKAVQAEIVVSPLRRGFTRKAWKTEHDNRADDKIDDQLFDAGLLILEKTNNIRAALKLTFSENFRPTTKIRAFAAVANYNVCALKSKTREAIAEFAQKHDAELPGAPIMAHEMAALKLELPIGAKFGPDEIIEGTVDGVQVPLKRILELDPDLDGNPEFGKIDWVEVQMDFNLGVLYHYAESLWDDCLWNSYRADRKEDKVTFSPRDAMWQVLEAMSRTRYTALSGEFAVHAIHAYKALLASGRLPAFAQACVKSVEKVGKRQAIRLGTFDAESEVGEWLFTMRGYASEPYYTELLNEAQPTLNGASLNQLITAWTITVSASNLLQQELDAIKFTKPEDPKTWMPNHAPILQVAALVRAAATVSACSYPQATAIVEFLIFRGKVDQELWAQPLLPVSREAVVPLFAATSSPNLRRLVDVWLKQLGVDLSLRGPAFEAHIRVSLQHDIETSPLLARSSSCSANHVVFTPDGEREEEIDVVVLVGDVLIVGEAKCFLEPVEAKEIARHREKVLESVAQVKRKASAVDRHKQAFRTRAADEGIAIPEEFHVQPLVILNNAIHVGVPIENVPVVDAYILGAFFRGSFVELALKEPGKPLRPVRRRVLYESPEQAAQVLSGFLSAPPQMEPLLNGIDKRWVPVPGAAEGDWIGEFLAVSCIPKVEALVHDEV